MKKVQVPGLKTLTDEQIESALEDYLARNPIDGHVTVDSVLSEESENPVQNKVVTSKIKDVETTVGNINALLETI